MQGSLNPNAKITIDELGNIYQNDQLVTRIGVVDFDDYNYISKYGENLYDLVEDRSQLLMQRCSRDVSKAPM